MRKKLEEYQSILMNSNNTLKSLIFLLSYEDDLVNENACILISLLAAFNGKMIFTIII